MVVKHVLCKQDEGQHKIHLWEVWMWEMLGGHRGGEWRCL